MPSDGAQFSKRAPRHRRNKKSQGSNVWRQILQNRGKQKLFEMNITWERKETIPSFERKSSLESLAPNIPEWPNPSHAHNLSFTHDGYIRHTATEMIILMTDISSYGTQRVNVKKVPDEWQARQATLVSVCHDINVKKVPDEWQARRATLVSVCHDVNVKKVPDEWQARRATLVSVCHDINVKKVPDEWQARRATLVSVCHDVNVKKVPDEWQARRGDTCKRMSRY